MGKLAGLWARGTYVRFIVKEVLPRTADALRGWERRIATIPNKELRRQAWASITDKRFHAEGGSVYGALAPDHVATLVPLIVALQTISDYLDNLCDRSVSMDETDFRQLHQALLDALDGRPPREGAGPIPYYRCHPNKDDGGYLAALVDECRRHVLRLPSYDVVKPYVGRLMGLYNDLQVYKHGPLHRRVPALEGWFAEHWPPRKSEPARWQRSASAKTPQAPKLHWWEFAAASGSTLGVFALFAAATRPDLTGQEADALVAAYFPWICGLHILLDYFIDQAEDVAGGDLNLVSYYKNAAYMQHRLQTFVRRARRQAASLPDRAFHTTIVQGLPGLYLSDRKVPEQGFQPIARRLLRTAGPASFGYYAWCRWRRLRQPEGGRDGSLVWEKSAPAPRG